VVCPAGHCILLYSLLPPDAPAPLPCSQPKSLFLGLARISECALSLQVRFPTLAKVDVSLCRPFLAGDSRPHRVFCMKPSSAPPSVRVFLRKTSIALYHTLPDSDFIFCWLPIVETTSGKVASCRACLLSCKWVIVLIRTLLILFTY